MYLNFQRSQKPKYYDLPAKFKEKKNTGFLHYVSVYTGIYLWHKLLSSVYVTKNLFSVTHILEVLIPFSDPDYKISMH